MPRLISILELASKSDKIREASDYPNGRKPSKGSSMFPIQPGGPQRTLRPDPPAAPKAPDPAHKPADPSQPAARQNPAAAIARGNLVRLMAELDRIMGAFKKDPARAYVALDTLRKQEIFALTEPNRFTQWRDADEAQAIRLKFELLFRECAQSLTPSQMDQARLCAAYLQEMLRTSRDFEDFMREFTQSTPAQRAQARAARIQRVRAHNKASREICLALTLLLILASFLLLPPMLALLISVVLAGCGWGIYWAFLRQAIPDAQPAETGAEADGVLTAEWIPLENQAAHDRLEVIRQVMGDEFARCALPYLLGPGGKS
jgi:hypothetical protein